MSLLSFRDERRRLPLHFICNWIKLHRALYASERDCYSLKIFLHDKLENERHFVIVLCVSLCVCVSLNRSNSHKDLEFTAFLNTIAMFLCPVLPFSIQARLHNKCSYTLQALLSNYINFDYSITWWVVTIICYVCQWFLDDRHADIQHIIQNHRQPPNI